MKKVLILIFFVSLSSVAQEKVRLFFLGGQSNMVGHGHVEDLPPTLDKTFENVWIFHGNTSNNGEQFKGVGGQGIWAPLQPGHGKKMKSTSEENRYSKFFGVELSFAAKLQEQYPDEKIAIIKYARGGSSIFSGAAQNWDINEEYSQLYHFQQTVKNALSNTDIDNDGTKEELVFSGIVWMQGESDTYQIEKVSQYAKQLKGLMYEIRETLGSQQAPIIVGMVTDSGKHSKTHSANFKPFQEQQRQFVEEDNFATLVTDTEKYECYDSWHYKSEGCIDLGKRFAEEIIKSLK